MVDQAPVVSNTTPLITLAGVGLLELLPTLYGTITIATQVLHEYEAKLRAGDLDLRAARWLTVVAVTIPVARAGIVDCDVHPLPRSADEIRAYMPMPWRDRYRGGGRGFFDNPIHSLRLHSRPPDGGQPASNPAFLREQLIDAYSVTYAILLPRAFYNLHPDPDFGTAYNDWLADTWLSRHNHDGVVKGSITVAHQAPQAAAREIERWARRPARVAGPGSCIHALIPEGL